MPTIACQPRLVIVVAMAIIILENIRSHYNVGAIFRTADAVGVEKIFLTGYTPAPVDRFGRVVGEISKTALGAEATVAWQAVGSVEMLRDELKTQGYQIVAVEQTKTALALPDFKPPAKTAYLLGNETAGVSEKSLSLADAVVEIPMMGKKESLNVSVAAGIVLYHDFMSRYAKNRN